MAKIKNVESWGRDTAKERYKLHQDRLPDDQDMKAHNEETPQDPVDQRGTKYDNNAEGWVRGSRSGEPKMKDETGENYPDGNFDKGSRTGKR